LTTKFQIGLQILNKTWNNLFKFRIVGQKLYLISIKLIYFT